MARGRPRISISPCRFCHKQFKRLEHLQRHERIHTQEKPFACHCGQRYSRSDLLFRHERVAHHQHGELESPLSAQQSSPETIAEPRVLGDTQLPDAQQQPQDERANNTNMGSGSREVVVIEQDNLRHVNSKPGEGQRQVIAAHILPELDRIEALPVMSSSVPNFQHQNPHISIFDFSINNNGQNPGDVFDSADDLDFLWNDLNSLVDFLPANYFDTDFSLADLSQARLEVSQVNSGDSSYPQTLTNGPRLPTDGLQQPTNISRFSSRLPSLEPDRSLVEASGSTRKKTSRGATNSFPWVITSSAYENVRAKIHDFSGHLPDQFSVPSRYTLSRFIEGYFRGFHEHLPFLHSPTLSTETLAPELILALAAVGALYRFEHAKGYELFFASKAVISAQLQRCCNVSHSQLMSSSPNYAEFSGSISLDHRTPSRHNLNGSLVGVTPLHIMDQPALQTIQALMILMAMSSWGDRPVVRDSLSMASQLAMLVRELGLATSDEISPNATWSEWAAAEERRRTIFIAYALFNLQSIAFNVPPMILNQEISLCLPRSGPEWKATTESAWKEARHASNQQEVNFEHTLNRLLMGQEIHEEFPISALGNYILINALVQQIFFERQVASGDVAGPSPALNAPTLKKFESALRAWQNSWEATQESTLDPSSPKGPVGFNATALLRLAYIRLNANTGPYRKLDTRDPERIARAFIDESILVFKRSTHVDRAVLQCIHALSVPVRVGIAFVARTQTLNWSIQHSLCNLECAFLLSRWLRSIAESIKSLGVSSLREDERKLLGMITSLVQETDFANDLGEHRDSAVHVEHLAAIVSRLWAETFRGFHVFQMVHVVGISLTIVADYLESKCKN